MKNKLMSYEVSKTDKKGRIKITWTANIEISDIVRTMFKKIERTYSEAEEE